MSIKRDALLALWSVAGIFSIYIGILQLRFPDAAWKRVAESLERSGKVAEADKALGPQPHFHRHADVDHWHVAHQ